MEDSTCKNSTIDGWVLDISEEAGGGNEKEGERNRVLIVQRPLAA